MEMTKIRLPTTDARIEQGVRAGLEAALHACRTERDTPEMTDEESTGAMVCENVIRALAADPDAVARIAKGARHD